MGGCLSWICSGLVDAGYILEHGAVKPQCLAEALHGFRYGILVARDRRERPALRRGDRVARRERAPSYAAACRLPLLLHRSCTEGEFLVELDNVGMWRRRGAAAEIDASARKLERGVRLPASCVRA